MMFRIPIEGETTMFWIPVPSNPPSPKPQRGRPHGDSKCKCDACKKWDDDNKPQPMVPFQGP